jgi:hypothetical protein
MRDLHWAVVREDALRPHSTHDTLEAAILAARQFARQFDATLELVGLDGKPKPLDCAVFDHGRGPPSMPIR